MFGLGSMKLMLSIGSIVTTGALVVFSVFLFRWAKQRKSKYTRLVLLYRNSIMYKLGGRRTRQTLDSENELDCWKFGEMSFKRVKKTTRQT